MDFAAALEWNVATGEGAPLHDPCTLAWLLAPELFELVALSPRGRDGLAAVAGAYGGGVPRDAGAGDDGALGDARGWRGGVRASDAAPGGALSHDAAHHGGGLGEPRHRRAR